ncbi:MAG: hypothetical protein OXE45_14325, partial [bacterium]|nr:hypothetical protein [bacterium]
WPAISSPWSQVRLRAHPSGKFGSVAVSAARSGADVLPAAVAGCPRAGAAIRGRLAVWRLAAYTVTIAAR